MSTRIATKPIMKSRGRPKTKSIFDQRQKLSGKPRQQQRRVRWQNEELQVLHDYFPTMTVKAIQARYLPERTAAAIKLQAKREHIHREVCVLRWTSAENALLREHYPALSRAELRRRYIPHRTPSAIGQQASRLGLRRQF